MGNGKLTVKDQEKEDRFDVYIAITSQSDGISMVMELVYGERMKCGAKPLNQKHMA